MCIPFFRTVAKQQLEVKGVPALSKEIALTKLQTDFSEMYSILKNASTMLEKVGVDLVLDLGTTTACSIKSLLSSLCETAQYETKLLSACLLLINLEESSVKAMNKGLLLRLFVEFSVFDDGLKSNLSKIRDVKATASNRLVQMASPFANEMLRMIDKEDALTMPVFQDSSEVFSAVIFHSDVEESKGCQFRRCN